MGQHQSLNQSRCDNSPGQAQSDPPRSLGRRLTQRACADPEPETQALGRPLHPMCPPPVGSGSLLSVTVFLVHIFGRRCAALMHLCSFPSPHLRSLSIHKCSLSLFPINHLFLKLFILWVAPRSPVIFRALCLTLWTRAQPGPTDDSGILLCGSTVLLSHQMEPSPP